MFWITELPPQHKGLSSRDLSGLTQLLLHSSHRRASILGLGSDLLEVLLCHLVLFFKKLALVSSILQLYSHLGHFLLALAVSSLFGFQLLDCLQGSRITFPGLFFGSGKFRPKVLHGSGTICIKHTRCKLRASSSSYQVSSEKLHTLCLVQPLVDKRDVGICHVKLPL